MLRVKRWWMRVVGRRGSALLFFAFLNSFYCWSLLSLPPEARESNTFKFINGFAPIELWAGAWGLSGLLCLIFAFRRWDGLAFAGAMTIYPLWGLIYLVGEFANQIYRGAVASSIWFALTLFVWLISGWPEFPGGDSCQKPASSSPD